MVESESVTPFHTIVRDFVHDILRVFPEMEETLEGDLKLVAIDDAESVDAAGRVREHVLKVMPKRFFDILYQNEIDFTAEKIIIAVKNKIPPK